MASIGLNAYGHRKEPVGDDRACRERGRRGKNDHRRHTDRWRHGVGPVKPADVADRDDELDHRTEPNRAQRLPIDSRPARANTFLEQSRIGSEGKVNGGRNEDRAEHPESGKTEGPPNANEQAQEHQPAEQSRRHRPVILTKCRVTVENLPRSKGHSIDIQMTPWSRSRARSASVTPAAASTSSVSMPSAGAGRTGTRSA